MRHIEHLKESVARARQAYLGIYERNPAKIRKLLCRLHKTLDAYFDPTDENPLFHRQFLHHREGIQQVTQELSEEFGREYEDIIKYEASRHVIADMGQVYTKEDYSTPYFWDRWRAKNEDIICWI